MIPRRKPIISSINLVRLASYWIQYHHGMIRILDAQKVNDPGTDMFLSIFIFRYKVGPQRYRLISQKGWRNYEQYTVQSE
jgi:hypothetical protein